MLLSMVAREERLKEHAREADWLVHCSRQEVVTRGQVETSTVINQEIRTKTMCWPADQGPGPEVTTKKVEPLNLQDVNKPVVK